MSDPLERITKYADGGFFADVYAYTGTYDEFRYDLRTLIWEVAAARKALAFVRALDRAVPQYVRPDESLYLCSQNPLVERLSLKRRASFPREHLAEVARPTPSKGQSDA